MIYHELQAIFVHIPKSAGTSIGTHLGGYSDEAVWGMLDHRSLRHLTPLSSLNPFSLSWSGCGEVIYRRCRDTIFLKRNYPTEDQLRTYYKFTFVRNSWARVFSWYGNVMNDARHRRRYKVPEGATFDWFIANRMYTLRDQLYYIVDIHGDIGVNFVGRFETRQSDFDKICDRIGLEVSVLPEKNRIGNSSYVDHYTSASRELVGAQYKRDIDYFGFTFGE